VLLVLYRLVGGKTARRLTHARRLPEAVTR
jgi:hypothetical protein